MTVLDAEHTIMHPDADVSTTRDNGIRRLDAVSGATFTSASYDQSLQSALDKLGFKPADGSRATLQVP